MKKFNPVMDWWLAVLVVAFVLVLLTSLPFLLAQPFALWQRILIAFGLVLTVLYIVDLAFFTRYWLTEDGLLIHSQFRRILFPYRDMEELRNGNLFGLFSLGSRKRFALSSNNIAIRLRRGIWRVITVSPKERQHFTDELLKMIDHDRSRRLSHS